MLVWPSQLYTELICLSCPSAPDCVVFSYSSMFQVSADNPSWRSAAAAQKLAASMLEVYSSLKDSFSPDAHRHYLFTPRHLTRWVMGLQRYDLQGQDLLQVLVHMVYDKRVVHEAKLRSKLVTRLCLKVTALMWLHWHALYWTGAAVATSALHASSASSHVICRQNSSTPMSGGQCDRTSRPL